MSILKAEENIFLIISSAGSAKSYVFDALRESRKGNFDNASNLLKCADDELKKAHGVQTELLQNEAAGNKGDNISLLMIHAQDHLMTAMLARDLADEIIALNSELYQRRNEQ